MAKNSDTTDAATETLPQEVLDLIERAAVEGWTILRHIESGVVGIFRSSGTDTDNVHVTAIQGPDGEIVNAPTDQFEPVVAATPAVDAPQPPPEA